MNDGKRSLKSWIIATRPWSFPASSMPVLVTLAYLTWMGVEINWLTGVWALVNIVIFHAAGNTWSDYYDYIKGVDREDTIGGMSIVSGEFKAQEIRTLAAILLAVAVAAGIGLLCLTGVETLYFGLAGCLLTIGYPWLKFHALGDLDIFLTYSLLPILGTSFVACGTIHPQLLWLTVPIGLITVGILHVNNTRDTEHDSRANIKTFAMILGKKTSAYLYCFEVVFPFVWVIAAIVAGAMPVWSLLVLVALKPAIDNARKAMASLTQGLKALIGVDELTAKLQLIFSLLLTVSLFVSALL